MKRVLFFSALCLISIFPIALFTSPNKYFAEFRETPKETTIPLSSDWAETTLANLTLEEKIAQLMMIRVHSNYSPEILGKIAEQIKQYQPGGICFFQGGPVRQANLTNFYQSISHIPMLIAIDGEWGPAMRLDSCIAFPRQMTLGAMDASGDELIYEMGKEIGRQCNALGIHINFAPDVDVNNNPNNPVINSRSFGESKEKVAQKAYQYMRGLQEMGVSACAKHFPGHGDTETDSHHDLPVIKKSRAELDSLEFYPFRKMIKEGVDMVMVSHLNIPALDEKENSISSLSYETITMLLRKEMGYDGIVITDGMDMAGLRKSYPSGGDAEIEALLAGVDILLLPENLGIVIPAIVDAVYQGRIPEELINEHCLRVLQFKESKGVNKNTKINTRNLYSRLNSENATILLEKMFAKSLTLLKNEDILPLSPANNKTYALLCIGGMADSTLLQDISQQHGIPMIQTDRSFNNNKTVELIEQLKPYDQIIVGILSTNQSARHQYGVYKETATFVSELARKKKIILSLFGNPYALSSFNNLHSIPAIIIGYQPTIEAVKVTLNAVFGNASFEGNLPVSIPGYPLNSGIRMVSSGLAIPENISRLPNNITESIDSIVENGIANKIFPGCQVIAIRKGETVFHKQYGKLTYHAKGKVQGNTLYDIASITKIAATTLAVMKLHEEGSIKITDKIGVYLNYLKEEDKKNITIAELLTHTSGLPAFIPFYKELTNNGTWNHQYLRDTRTDDFSIEVAKKVYLEKSYPEVMRERVATCKLGKKEYRYSDLGFVLLQDIIEHISGTPLDQFVTKHFYDPLELHNTCFNPLIHHHKPSVIAPTEDDHIFRKQIIQGYVHDQTAALFGGVCGNAGLFSNTSELAVLFHVLMNQGVYKGKRYFDQKTIELFTNTYPLHQCHRRGLGFDTPGFKQKSSLLPEKASKKTFGHQGFTGTVVWCDPDNELIYIFLSNRISPNVEPNKLAKSKIRLLIHEKIYETF